MNESIKNFIEEGERELNHILWNNIDENVINCERPMKKQLSTDLKQFISSRQISLIKMIVDEIIQKEGRKFLDNKFAVMENYMTIGEYRVGTDLLDTISSKLKEIYE